MHPVVNCTGAWLLTSTRCTLLAVSLCMVLCMALGMVLGVWVALFAHHCVVISEGFINQGSINEGFVNGGFLIVGSLRTHRNTPLLFTADIS